MIGMPEVNNLMNNEMVIHHVLGSFSTFEQQFNTDRVEPLELNPELAVEDDDDVSTTPEPGLWLSYMQKRSGKVPDFILTDGACRCPGRNDRRISVHHYLTIPPGEVGQRSEFLRKPHLTFEESNVIDQDKSGRLWKACLKERVLQ